MPTKLSAVLFVLLATATAWAGLGKLKGQIVLSDQPLPAMNDDGDKAADQLKKANKDKLERSKDSDGWSFHMMAFLDKRPGVTSLSLMLYDITDGKHNYLTSKDISCDVGAEILASDIDVSEDDGVKAGMKIEIDLAKIVGDKEIDLAKTKVTFTAAK